MLSHPPRPRATLATVRCWATVSALKARTHPTPQLHHASLRRFTLKHSPIKHTGMHHRRHDGRPRPTEAGSDDDDLLINDTRLSLSRVKALPKSANTRQRRDLYDALMGPLEVTGGNIPEGLSTDPTEYFATRVRTEPEVVHLLTMQRAQARVRPWDGWLQQMEATFEMGKEIQPTCRLHTCIMCAYADAGLPDKALECLESMSEQGLVPDLHSYTTVVSAFVAAGRLDDAYKFLQEMERSGKKLDVVVFAPLIKGSLAAGDVDRCWRTFDYMRTYHAEPDEVIFTMMLRACTVRSEIERARNLLEEMIQMKLVPTEVTYNSLIACSARRVDSWQLTWQLFEMMKDEGYQPGQHVYNTLLAACSRAGELEVLRQVLDEMEANHIHTDLVTYNTLIAAVLWAQRHAVTSDARAHNVARARELFDELLEKGFTPDVITVNTMVGVAAEALHLRTAEKMLDMFDEYGLEKDVVTYRTMAMMYARASRPHKSIALIRTMHEKGFKVDGRLALNLAHKCAGLSADKVAVGVEVLKLVGIDVHTFAGDFMPHAKTAGSRHDQSARDRLHVFEEHGTRDDAARTAQKQWAKHIMRCHKCRKTYASPVLQRKVKWEGAYL